MPIKKACFILLLISLMLTVNGVIPEKTYAKQEKKVMLFSSGSVEVDLSSGNVTLEKWNKEAYLLLKLPSGKLKKTSEVLSNGTVIINLEDSYIKIYELNIDEGGIEYEIVINGSLTSNVISIPIKTKNLVWYYQPPLDQELNISNYDFVNATHAIKNGRAVFYRPENVVGSYAFYHAYKRNNEYKTGKAFHLYRPLAIDAKGNKAWCNLTVSSKEITITIPKSFIESAAYPIIIDPTFGYTTAGASTGGPLPADIALGTVFTSPSDTDMIGQSISIYGYADPADNVKACIWLNSTGSLITDGVTEAVTAPELWNWFTLNFPSSPSISSNTEYIVGFIDQNAYFEYAYDSGGTTYEDRSNSYDAPQDFDTRDATHDQILSIYVTYTTAAANNPPTIGEFQIPSIVYDGEYFYFNATINDADGVADFVNATVHFMVCFNELIILWVNSTDSFSVYQNPPSGEVVVDSSGSFKTQLNTTAYKLTWRMKLSGFGDDGDIHIRNTNTRVYDASGDFGYTGVDYISEWKNKWESDIDIIRNSNYRQKGYPYIYNFTNFISSLSWADNKLTVVVNATSGSISTVIFNTQSWHMPRYVWIKGVAYTNPKNTYQEFTAASPDCWYYQDSTNLLYVKVLHESPVEIILDWTQPPAAPPPPEEEEEEAPQARIPPPPKISPEQISIIPEKIIEEFKKFPLLWLLPIAAIAALYYLVARWRG